MGKELLSAYFASLSPLALLRAIPGSIAQGLIWGLLALGVYITYKLLDFADLSVDGSFATGGAVAVMLIRGNMNPWLSLLFAFAAGMIAGLITGLLHTKLGIPPILAGILTQIALYSINLNIMGKSNQAVSVMYPVIQVRESAYLQPVFYSAWLWLLYFTGILARSRDMLSVLPDVMPRWHVHRESIRISVRCLH